jgi:hypothetical protein
MSLFPLIAKSYKFELSKETSLNGVSLDTGIYRLKLNPTRTKAEIWDRGKLAVTARVEVEPLGNSTKNTVLIDKTGTLSEYRSQREKIRFVDAVPNNLHSGH